MKNPLTSKEIPTSKPVVELATGAVVASRLNPRKSFAGIEDLAADIALFGVQQPIMVRPHPEQDGFEIIMGERRWRACKHLGLAVIPAIVMEATDCDLVERALSENLSRQDLSCIETAEGFQSLLSLNRALTHEALATRHRLPGGATRISNLLRLLKLPWQVRDLLAEGLITEGHGTALCALDGQPDYQKALADQVIDESLSVAELREKVRIKVAFLKEREQNPSLPLGEGSIPHDVPATAPRPAPSTGSSSSTSAPSAPVPDVKSGFTPAQATLEFEASQKPDPDVPPLSSLPIPPVADTASGGAPLPASSPAWPESTCSASHRYLAWIEKAGLDPWGALAVLARVVGPDGLERARRPGTWVCLEPEIAGKLSDLCQWHALEHGPTSLQDTLVDVIHSFHAAKLEQRTTKAGVLEQWDTDLPEMAIMAPTAGYWENPAMFSMPEESVRKAMDNSICSRISLSKFTGAWIPKKAIEWNGCLWICTGYISSSEYKAADLWRVVPVDDPHARTVQEALPATDRKGYHGVLLGAEDRRGNLTAPQFMVVGPPIRWRYDKAIESGSIATTRAAMGDRQRQKELADQAAAQARRQARAQAHEARVAESLRRAEERKGSANGDPAPKVFDYAVDAAWREMRNGILNRFCALEAVAMEEIVTLAEVNTNAHDYPNPESYLLDLFDLQESGLRGDVPQWGKTCRFKVSICGVEHRIDYVPRAEYSDSFSFYGDQATGVSETGYRSGSAQHSDRDQYASPIEWAEEIGKQWHNQRFKVKRAKKQPIETPTVRVYPALETMQPETQEAIGNMVTAVIDAANRGELPRSSEASHV